MCLIKFYYFYSGGIVVVMELNFDSRRKQNRLRTCNDHKGMNVTALKWSGDGSRLFAGDDMGKVTAVNVPQSKVSFISCLF